MAHHHPYSHASGSQRHVEVVVQRPILLRLLSLVTLVMPFIFYILSMAFTLASIYNESFALSYPWDTEAGGPVWDRTYKASPFFVCTLTDDQSVAHFRKFVDTCTRLGSNAIGKKGIDFCHTNYGGGSTQFCAQRVLSAELTVAGAALSGIAALGALIFIGLGWKRATAATTTTTALGSSAESTGLISSETDDVKESGAKAESRKGVNSTGSPTISALSICLPFFTAVTTLIALVGAVALVLAQSTGYNALVNLQVPGVFSPDENNQTRWILGVAGQLYLTLAYVFAAVGVLVVVVHSWAKSW